MEKEEYQCLANLYELSIESLENNKKIVSILEKLLELYESEYPIKQ
jgi:hypothetical protein